MHPLFHLIATRPHLLVDHAEAYGELVGAEMDTVTTSWKRSAMLYGVTAFLLILGVGLAGVAVLLLGVYPTAQMPAPWVLIVVPLVPIVIGVGCLLAARTTNETRVFDNLRRQLAEDVAMLREGDAT